MRKGRVLLPFEIAPIVGHTFPPSMGQVHHGIVVLMLGHCPQKFLDVLLQVQKGFILCSAQMGLQFWEKKKV